MKLVASKSAFVEAIQAKELRGDPNALPTWAFRALKDLTFLLVEGGSVYTRAPGEGPRLVSPDQWILPAAMKPGNIATLHHTYSTEDMINGFRQAHIFDFERRREQENRNRDDHRDSPAGDVGGQEMDL